MIYSFPFGFRINAGLWVVRHCRKESLPKLLTWKCALCGALLQKMYVKITAGFVNQRMNANLLTIFLPYPYTQSVRPFQLMDSWYMELVLL